MTLMKKDTGVEAVLVEVDDKVVDPPGLALPYISSPSPCHIVEVDRGGRQGSYPPPPPCLAL